MVNTHMYIFVLQWYSTCATSRTVLYDKRTFRSNTIHVQVKYRTGSVLTLIPSDGQRKLMDTRLGTVPLVQVGTGAFPVSVFNMHSTLVLQFFLRIPHVP